MKRLVLALLFVSGVAYAAPNNSVSTPNSFTPLSTIQSSQVNDNFNEVSTKYNSHTHNDITGVGTITTGVWSGTAISTSNGGTGKDLSAVAQGSVVYFDGTGSVSTLSPGSNGQVLKTSGAGANPSWTSNTVSDIILRGMEVNYNSAGSVIASAGTVCVGTTVVNSATANILTLATASNWSSGSVVSYGGGANWCYVGIKSSGEVKLLGNLPPGWADISGNRQGTKLYSYDGTDTWRVLGAFRVAVSDTMANIWYQNGNYVYYDVPISATSALSSGAWSSALSCITQIPKISTLGVFGCETVRAGASSSISLKMNGTTGGTPYHGNTVAGDGNVDGQLVCMTDQSQQIQYYNQNSTTTAIDVLGYYLNIR